MAAAGTFRYYINIYKPTLTVGDFGQQTEEFEEFHCTKAAVQFFTGARDIQNTEVLYNYPVTFEVRMFTRVDERCRIKFQGRWYRILSIIDDIHLQKKIINTELINE